jgi:hypothetical protein
MNDSTSIELETSYSNDRAHLFERSPAVGWPLKFVVIQPS